MRNRHAGRRCEARVGVGGLGVVRWRQGERQQRELLDDIEQRALLRRGRRLARARRLTSGGVGLGRGWGCAGLRAPARGWWSGAAARVRARIGLACGAGSACTAPPAHSSSTSAAGLPSIRRSRCPAASVAVPRATNEEAVGWKNRLKVHEHLARVRARVRAWVRARAQPRPESHARTSCRPGAQARPPRSRRVARRRRRAATSHRAGRRASQRRSRPRRRRPTPGHVGVAGGEGERQGHGRAAGAGGVLGHTATSPHTERSPRSASSSTSGGVTAISTSTAVPCAKRRERVSQKPRARLLLLTSRAGRGFEPRRRAHL